MASTTARTTATHTYVVQPGDTLSAIARREGTTVAAIAAANNIVDVNRIYVGQRLTIPGTGTTTTTPPPTGTTTTVAPGPVVHGSASGRKQIALTFDDGPNGSYTDAVLGVLSRHHVKATFFVVGENAARDGARLRKIRDAGHTIGNHSWNHPQLTRLSQMDVRSQLSRTSDAIFSATGRRPSIFRPPYGARSSAIDSTAASLGLRDITWDVDTVDWSRPGVAAIRHEAVNSARNGSIILMHDGGGNRQQTVDALDDIITDLQRKGYQLVTVPQLIATGPTR